MVEQVEQKHKQHTVHFENRAQLQMSGIEDVIRATEKEIFAKSCKGAFKITGEQLHVEKLDIATGELAVTGQIGGVVYTSAKSKKSLFKRLFQ